MNELVVLFPGNKWLGRISGEISGSTPGDILGGILEEIFDGFPGETKGEFLGGNIMVKLYNNFR